MARGKVIRALMRGAQAPTREQVMDMVRQHTQKLQEGPRRGWQVKAASWVKKVQVDRGDVKVGAFKDGRFQLFEHLLPRYLVPEGLSECELKPYVQRYELKPAKDAKNASGEAPK